MGLGNIFGGNKKSQTTNQSSTTTNSNVNATAGGLGVSSTGSGPVSVSVLDGGAIDRSFSFGEEALAAVSATTDRFGELVSQTSNTIRNAYAEANRSEGAAALEGSQKTLRAVLLGGAAIAAVAVIFGGKKK